MTDDKLDPFESIFGKAPDSGYKFLAVEVELIDNPCFKGFDIAWSAQGIGFGHVTFAWGLDLEYLKDFPKQHGFHTDTECMSQEFVQALLIEAAPKMAALLCKHDRL